MSEIKELKNYFKNAFVCKTCNEVYGCDALERHKELCPNCEHKLEAAKKLSIRTALVKSKAG